MTARDEILEAAKMLVSSSTGLTFTADDLVRYLARQGSRYTDSTIPTHVTSRMCANAPKHHAVTYDDFVNVGPGRYRLTA